jgi:hypothetical protein
MCSYDVVPEKQNEQKMGLMWDETQNQCMTAKSSLI